MSTGACNLSLEITLPLTIVSLGLFPSRGIDNFPDSLFKDVLTAGVFFTTGSFPSCLDPFGGVGKLCFPATDVALVAVMCFVFGAWTALDGTAVGTYSVETRVRFNYVSI